MKDPARVWIAIGDLAIRPFLAMGGLALGFQAAKGGLAASFGYALGGAAYGPQANTREALAYFAKAPFWLVPFGRLFTLFLPPVPPASAHQPAPTQRPGLYAEVGW